MDKEKTVKLIVERIERRLDDKLRISVADVAALSGYSIRYVQKIFKEVTRLNISDYIRKRRLTQAALLIKLTKKSIDNISSELSFSTQQSFTRAFNREFKITPIKFRQQTHFDCSYLTPSYTKNPYQYTIYSTNFDTLKLNGEEFTIKETLLKKTSSRGNAIRLKEIVKKLQNNDEVYLITKFNPKSTFSTEIYLHTFIGCRDSNATYEIKAGDCLAVDFTGLWDDYVIFGRLITLYVNIKFEPCIIEKIYLGEVDCDNKQIYHITSYLPLVDNK
ncbi:TPA: helix-turn-helix transcriptional regulator [Salmonella enterica subsp. salamae]|nr:helix-turn-helix transcriptional regulator [Salmonella enterica subsp. salamae]